ncbi:MAG: hypothetical protein J6T61_00870 [Spirochaetia bacterium]|nr:hypothetical protein [Spirochaetia bacterium]
MKKNDIWRLALLNAPFAQEATPLDFLKELDSDSLYRLIKGEPPTVIAPVLHCIGYDKSLCVLEKCQMPLQKEVLRAMYLGDMVDRGILNIIANALRRKIEKKG